MVQDLNITSMTKTSRKLEGDTSCISSREDRVTRPEVFNTGKNGVHSSVLIFLTAFFG